MDYEPNTPEVVEAEIVATKAEQAYMMLRHGELPSDVADTLGYSSVSVMRQAIKHKIESDATKLSNEDKTTILQMELIGLQELKKAHYQAAMLGDLKSGEMLLKIFDRVYKAIGADSMDSAVQQHAVLVIGGEEADYVQKLKELTE